MFIGISSLIRNMTLVGWNTEKIPIESAQIALSNLEKAYQGLQAQMKGK